MSESEASIDQLMQTARQFQGQGRTPETESVCRQVLVRDPDYTPALRLLGAILAHTGRTEEAATALSKCVRLDPNDAAAHSTLGATLQILGHSDKAIKHLSKAVELQPQPAQF